MGKYMEMLDAGAKIANRIRAHYPQTSGLYYHPPTSNSRTMSKNATSSVESFSIKVDHDEMDTKEFILFIVIG